MVVTDAPPPLRIIGVGFVLRTLNLVRGFVLGLLTVAVLLRRMGTGDYGSAALALALAAGVGLLGTLGLEQAILRGVAGRPPEEDDWSRPALRTVLLTGGLAGLVLVAVGAIQGGTPGRAIELAGACAALVPVRTVVRSTLAARARIGRVEGAAALHDTVFCAIALTLAWTGHATPVKVVAAEAVGAVAGLVLQLPAWRVAAPRAPEGRRRRDVLWGTSPFLLATAAAMAGHYVGIWVLGWARGTGAVGRYAPILQLATTAQVLTGGLAAYYLTELVPARRRQDHAAAREVYATTAKWGLVLVTPVLLLLVAAPRLALLVLFGRVVPGGDVAARILGIGFGLNALTGFSGLSLLGVARPRTIAMRSLAVALTTVLLDVVLIPLLGTSGAALAAACALVGAGAVDALLVWRQTGLHPLRGDVLLVGATVLLAVAGATAADAGADWFRALAVAAPAGAVVLGVAYRMRSGAERELLRRLPRLQGASHRGDDHVLVGNAQVQAHREADDLGGQAVGDGVNDAPG